MRGIGVGLVVVVVLGVGTACGTGGVDSDLGEQVGPQRDVAIPPEASEYCALVEEFYERLGALISRSTDQVDLDRRFIGFVREQVQLFDRLAASAPEEIAVAADIQRDAFVEVAETGTTDPLETEGARGAERTTVAYEEEVCGIVV